MPYLTLSYLTCLYLRSQPFSPVYPIYSQIVFSFVFPFNLCLQQAAATAASLESKVFETFPVHVSFLEEVKKIFRRVQWKVKEESPDTAIKAGMNDRFRGCGVDRLDDRRAKGSLQFKRVLGHETFITMPTHPSLCFPRHGVQGRFIGLYDSYNVVNGSSHNPAFNVSDIKALTWTFEQRCARTSGSPIKGKPHSGVLI